MRALLPPPQRLRVRRRTLFGAGLVAVVPGVLALAGTFSGTPTPPARRLPPADLRDTGLYADAEMTRVASDNLAFVPQYPLWSDGARKRRWIHLPPGTAIDAADPEAWVFPVGTKLWKEFAFERRVETRYLERVANGSWIYATYRWSTDGHEARLAPEAGARGVAEIRPGVRHDLPSVADCKACHENRKVPVLGFTALQLSTDRDPWAPHADRQGPDALDLHALVARGLVRGLPDGDAAPRIAARSPRERAALGYLQANCGSCHTATGPIGNLGLALDRPPTRAGDVATAVVTTLAKDSHFRLPGAATERAARIRGGDPEQSVLWRRVASRNPSVQMPPIGTKVVDEEAAALLAAWIRDDLAPASPAPSSPAASAARAPSPPSPRMEIAR